MTATKAETKELMSERAKGLERPRSFRIRQFIDQYMISRNGTEAVRQVYGNVSWASVKAMKLLSDPRVMAEVEARESLMRERCKVDADRVLEELACIAFLDLSEVMTWDKEGNVTMKTPEEMSPAARRAISAVVSVKSGNRGMLKLKFHDKLPALVKLGEHTGLFKQETDGNGNTTNNYLIVTDQIMQRLARIAAAGGTTIIPGQLNTGRADSIEPQLEVLGTAETVTAG